LIARIPRTLDIVHGPSREAVGRLGESLLAAVANGKANANVIVQIPSMKTQHHSVKVIKK